MAVDAAPTTATEQDQDPNDPIIPGTFLKRWKLHF
jgi:hypothetical protein